VSGSLPVTDLADGYDIIGFDLDGVVYRGPDPVPNAASTIAELRRRGIRVGFVTNNAQRSPAAVAAHLTSLGIECAQKDVVTSAQATARIMAEALPPGTQVLVLGSAALSAEIADVGLTPTATRSPGTAAICVGFEPTLTWSQLNEGCFAVQAGAAWYACNDDLTRPDRAGMAIGMGGILGAMKVALPGRSPVMGGKPARPLLDETARRLGGHVGDHSPPRLLFVGDRLDTDIAGANNAGWDSLFVLSGSHSMLDLETASPDQWPTYVGEDLSALLTSQPKA